MTVFKPFQAFRPTVENAKDVAALPYDVMNEKEAREMTEGKPNTFLRIDRAEVNLPEGTDPHSKEVYDEARKLLDQKIEEGVYKQDVEPTFYLYRLTWKGRSQTGFVGLLSIEDYENDVIKKHEFTRAEKEQDRINHVDTTAAHTGPIFITYKAQDRLREIKQQFTQGEPETKVSYDDGVTHEIWPINDAAINKEITEIFEGVPAVYIADGHHRAASAYRVGEKRRNENPNHTGNEEYNFFLSVLFADEELYIMDYNRVVVDTNGLSDEEYMQKVEEKFDVREKAEGEELRPEEKHKFTMFFNDKAYELTPKAGTYDENHAVHSLDADILQQNLLGPILGIDDPRKSDRVDFIGGIRGTEGVTKRLEEDMKIGFLLHPVTIAELMRIADTGEVMPPKSTWFEPKLRSGLFIHRF